MWLVEDSFTKVGLKGSLTLEFVVEKRSMEKTDGDVELRQA
jgi:hypothetical protein